MSRLLHTLALFWLLTLPALADSLRVGFGSNKPPYVFETEARGLEYELVQAALRRAGYEMQAYFAPMERLHLMLARGEIDCITTTNDMSGVAAYYSDVYIHYHNAAAALSSRHLQIHTLDDLRGYSISAFQRARFLLGPEYAQLVNNHPRYREEAQQVSRNRLLYSGRVDVIIGDPKVIRYFNREVLDQVDITQPLTWYPLFPSTGYQVGFRFQIQRDQFNLGLAAIRRSGEYEEIERRYADY
ncbi:polar amino acid transport system substrate-binding protein [Pseudomonas sp. TE3786]